MFDTFGNKVRIKRTPETEEKGLADKEGEVFGQTTPSMMNLEIIGNLWGDFGRNINNNTIQQAVKIVSSKTIFPAKYFIPI